MIKKTQEGRSMVEMLGVLAIVGVLSIAGISGYSMAMNKYRVSRVLDQVQLLSVSIRTLYASQSSFTGITPAQLYQMQIIDNTICKDSACTAPVNAFGGSLTIAGGKSSAAGTDNDVFVLTYGGLPVSACVNLATADWGSTSSGLARIEINGSGNTFDGTSGKELPIAVSKAVTACSAGDANTVAWYMR
ncbi:hypothetical protein FACS1894186_5040 [Alphaproteobacteria bacterium]|nr:hypothetical protein FACS1894186_5040 [Alphaproteobacteria bacterium]